jgi:hypothetical protein
MFMANLTISFLRSSIRDFLVKDEEISQTNKHIYKYNVRNLAHL